MVDEAYLQRIGGAAELLAWFEGEWPTFHDAEVLSISLHRQEPSRIVVHTWRNTRRVDHAGFYICDKHVIVTFILEDVRDIELHGWNYQNVLSGLAIQRAEEGLRVLLGGIFGVDGQVVARTVRIELEPRSC